MVGALLMKAAPMARKFFSIRLVLILVITGLFPIAWSALAIRLRLVLCQEPQKKTRLRFPVFQVSRG